MPKQKISGKELVADIRAGVNYRDLKTKYNLTGAALDGVLQKLFTSGLVQYEELPEKPSSTCPRCGLPLEQDESPCKGCAIIRDVFKDEDQLPGIALKDLVTDLKAKKGFEEVRLRHRLSEEQLRKLLGGLLEAGIVKENDTPGKYTSAKSQASGIRELSRNVQIPTEESDSSMESDDILFCPKCGAKRVGGANFCARCGNALNIPSTATADVGQSLDNPASVDMPEKRLAKALSNSTCPACGTSLDREFEECPVCGIVVSKYQRKGGKRKQLTGGAVDGKASASNTDKPPNKPPALWKAASPIGLAIFLGYVFFFQPHETLRSMTILDSVIFGAICSVLITLVVWLILRGVYRATTAMKGEK
ncbi:MAG: zinc ribbon domain-containing protein [Desulfomonilaceae bacterium]